MRSYRCFFVLVFFLLLLCIAASASSPLPELPGYSAEEIKTRPLSAPSGNFGEWHSRTYRTAGGKVLEATLMIGPGAGPLVTGEEGTRTDDRPLGFGATYEVFSLEGKRAVLEFIPSVGTALAVALDQDATLTLESASLSGEEIAQAALHIIRSR